MHTPAGNDDSSTRIDATDRSHRSHRSQSAASPRAGRPAVLIGVLLTIGLLLAVVWMGYSVRESMRTLTRGTLRASVSSIASSLELWISESERTLSVAVSTKEVQSAARELIDRQTRIANESNAKAWTADSMLHRAEFDLIQGKIADRSNVGWALLNERSMVIASDAETLVGMTLPIPADVTSRLAARQSTVCRPIRCPVSLNHSGTYSVVGAPIMCVLVPVVDEARTVGSLAILVNPLDRFSKLLSVARRGRSGEAYAFDRQGLLLSGSRFDDQLRAVGLLDPDHSVSSALVLELRDPGANFLRGQSSPGPRRQQPLTFMADHATRGGTGENVLGYNDYRGVPVVGAWKWLPEYGMGIAAEMEVDEAYRPLRLIRRSLFGVLSVMGFGTLTLLAFGYWLRRANRFDGTSSRDNRKLGNYRLGELVGHGGMGSVYRGRHQFLRRDVAIKVLEQEDVNAQSVTRFEREVQMTSQLRHPNTIDIYDYGRAVDGTFYYVMEYVEGITLQELVDDYGPLPPSRVIHILLQICGSLSEAHELSMIHRDVKPSNVILTARSGMYDMVKVLDFGLVKQIESTTLSSESSVELTQSDGITGTPMYMSPEVVRDPATADQRSDLYSVGVVGYTLLAGIPPFDGDSSVDVCLKQLNDEPVRPSLRIDKDLPDDLQNILMSCMRKSAEDRPMTAADLADSLRHCQDAANWSTADAVRWWEVEYFGSTETDGSILDQANEHTATH